MDWFKFVGENLNNHGFSHVFIMGSPVIFPGKIQSIEKMMMNERKKCRKIVHVFHVSGTAISLVPACRTAASQCRHPCGVDRK